LSQTPKHVSFHVVERDETSISKIPLILKGEAEGEKKGGVVVLMVKQIVLRGPAQDIPDHLELDVTSLKVNDKILPSEIQLPESVTFHEPEGFFDQPLVICQPKQKEEEEVSEVCNEEVKTEA